MTTENQEFAKTANEYANDLLSRMADLLAQWIDKVRGKKERCLQCGEQVTRCGCTGGPQLEVECTCYEPEYGHQSGCPYYRRSKEAS